MSDVITITQNTIDASITTQIFVASILENISQVITAEIGIKGETGPQGATGPSGTTLPSPIVNVTSNYMIQSSDNNTTFANTNATGGVTLTLPTISSFTPLEYFFFMGSANQLTLQAPSGVTIANAGDASSSGGTFFAQSIGNYAALKLMTPTLWAITTLTGIWNFT